MSKLTINFHGICVHFKNVVPGVPHRVVLPNAFAVRFGTVFSETEPASSAPTNYYLLPHYAFLRVESDPTPLQGTFLHGKHLRLLNATPGQTMQYPPDRQSTFSLGNYVPRTEGDFSEDVVLGGRAACYFDLYEGTVSTRRVPSGACYTSVEIETDGPPRIMMTSLPGSPGGVTSEQLELAATTLSVANVDLDGDDDDATLDFLLNYLVVRDDIPRLLTRPVPGMDQYPKQLSPAQISAALDGLAQRIASKGERIDWVTQDEINAKDFFLLTASCSDANWP